MTGLTKADYPLAETRPGQITGKRGIALGDITLEAVLSGAITIADLQITPKCLQDQAEIAADVGRTTLAQNFQRAAELVDVPQDLIMSTYELLRPGRAQDKAALLDRAALLRQDYGANAIAAYIEDAADIYEKRGLFTRRY
jgi:glycerol dehydratase small subunit/propanediol dehydratase small subunit